MRCCGLDGARACRPWVPLRFSVLKKAESEDSVCVKKEFFFCWLVLCGSLCDGSVESSAGLFLVFCWFLMLN